MTSKRRAKVTRGSSRAGTLPEMAKFCGAGWPPWAGAQPPSPPPRPPKSFVRGHTLISPPTSVSPGQSQYGNLGSSPPLQRTDRKDRRQLALTGPLQLTLLFCPLGDALMQFGQHHRRSLSLLYLHLSHRRGKQCVSQCRF